MSRLKTPRICIGSWDKPCPTQAELWYGAVRCHSCASIHSQSSVAFDAHRVAAEIESRNLSLMEVERTLGFGDAYLSQAFARGRINYYRLDELACWLGTYVEELVA